MKSKEKSKEKIIKLIQENPYITISDICLQTGLSRSGVEKNIKILKQQGILVRDGSDKNGRWLIRNED